MRPLRSERMRHQSDSDELEPACRAPLQILHWRCCSVMVLEIHTQLRRQRSIYCLGKGSEFHRQQQTLPSQTLSSVHGQCLSPHNTVVEPLAGTVGEPGLV